MVDINTIEEELKCREWICYLHDDLKLMETCWSLLEDINGKIKYIGSALKYRDSKGRRRLRVAKDRRKELLKTYNDFLYRREHTKNAKIILETSMINFYELLDGSKKTYNPLFMNDKKMYVQARFRDYTNFIKLTAEKIDEFLVTLQVTSNDFTKSTPST
ncbi:hypothetical protein TNIN_188081 [Trichonephila inaurata madagascariensis]|uniref:Uncharacterized protein n=1 Tax=Trichonephila inaurata madagascariensis TaxID=2747483 RepID=A0A8X6X055_9ARAC|nr:hypothetical protein TNIN_188081 [Trichonephila inaurata madagascariensis]